MVDDFPVVGVIGGGQLARMMQQSAIALGVSLRLLANSPADSAAQVIADVCVGDHNDLSTLLEFANGCDVITFDHEHAPPQYLRELQAAGVAVHPGPDALIHAQDKLVMRQVLTAAGLPCPRWAELPRDPRAARETMTTFGREVGWPIVMKTSRGGYDGRGVWIIDDTSSGAHIVANSPLADGARWLLEERVDFRRELAALVARSPHGQAVAYPVAQTVQVDGVCSEVVAPGPGLSDEVALQAQELALQVAQLLGVTGVLAVELFETSAGLVINELAMRPHNSGHWSIDGAVTSQFENHLRAVLDLPLGSPAALARYSVMVNVVGTQRSHLYSAYRHVLARDPQLKVHMYGKAPRPGRKLGHVTLVGDDLDQLVERAHHGAQYLAGAIDD